VKGADYRVDRMIERDVVEAHAGRVVLIEVVPEVSTTLTAEKSTIGSSNATAKLAI
jgi:bifunctional ADP-heptose synthase (sugar kinase/adenylyltransferase)